MRIETYQNNILFSCATGTDRPLKREKSTPIIIGRNSFKNTYGSDGKINKYTIGQYFDKRI